MSSITFEYYTRPKKVSAWQYDITVTDGTVTIPAWVIDEVGTSIFAHEGKLTVLKHPVNHGDWLVRHEPGKVFAFTDKEFQRLYMKKD